MMLVQNMRQYDPAIARDSVSLKRKMDDILQEMDAKKLKMLTLGYYACNQYAYFSVLVLAKLKSKKHHKI